MSGIKDTRRIRDVVCGSCVDNPRLRIPFFFAEALPVRLTEAGPCGFKEGLLFDQLLDQREGHARRTGSWIGTRCTR